MKCTTDFVPAYVLTLRQTDDLSSVYPASLTCVGNIQGNTSATRAISGDPSVY